MGLVSQAISIPAQKRHVRAIVLAFYKGLGALSTRLGLDPVLELPLGPLGIRERFRMHAFKRDLSFLVQVFIMRVYERHCRLQRGDVAIDCGAYIGDFTVRASRLVGDEGLVLAFEPNPESYSICVMNVRLNNLGNVKLFNVALGERERQAFLEISQDNLGQTHVVDSREMDGPGPVQVRTLSEFIPLVGSRRVKLMKMHVEGYASKILKADPELLDSGIIENFAVELHPGEEDLQALLESHGYICKVERVWLYASFESPLMQ